MMKKISLFLTAFIIAVGFSGCGRTPLREILPSTLPPHQTDMKIARQRLDFLKKLLAQHETRGIGIFPASFKENIPADKVINFIKAAGFNRIYCCITSETELDGFLEKFVILAAKNKIPVEIVISQQDYFRSYRSNTMLRNLLVKYPSLVDAGRMTAKFNDSLPETAKLAGITVELTPHIYNGHNTDRNYRSLFRWDDKNYGPGMDNDMLMIDAVKQLKKISEIKNIPPVTVAIRDFYHEQAESGKLSTGKVADFAGISSRIAVINSANLPSQLPEKVKAELKAAPKGTKILTVIPLATHSTDDSTRLRRRNLNDFVRAVNNFNTAVKNVPASGGVILSPLSVIYYMSLEK